MIRRCLPLLLVLCALPACQTMIDGAKLVGLMQPPELELDRPMPEDFKFSMSYRAMDGRDHTGLLAYTADGALSYKFSYPGTTRPVRLGEEQVSDEAVAKLWQALGELDYDELDELYTYDGEPDRTYGEREFFVRAGAQEHRVVASYVSVAELDKLQALVFEITPDAIFSSDYSGEKGPSLAPDHWVGDSKFRHFFPSDSDAVKEIPESRRVIFDTFHQALDARYDPQSAEFVERAER